ncbi:effector binding domain-containing protein [Enterococcus devriesei]|uniref:AraC family transcriptional regulator n=1 Tax=Enterococcus devriesei TaxID=319970 RepID=UPI0028EA8E3D|nr:helix-turn-helix domain-containing protein [Enterococcus devriesei]
MPKDIERFTQTLNYIEMHLFEEISLKELAQQALLAEYTFHRFFTYLTGYSFSSYLRKRRLSQVVDYLRTDAVSIDELSEMCGYANRPAFNRAFTKFHGLTPTQAKDPQATVNFFPPIRLKLQIDGGRTLNYRIETLPEFLIVGMMQEYPLDEHLFTRTCQHWEQFFQNAELRKVAETGPIITNFFGVNRAPYFAVANPRKPTSGKLTYCTGFAMNQPIEENQAYTVPAQTYAVFTSDSYDYRVLANVSAAFDTLQRQIFDSWLPQTDYQKVNGPELETYVSLEDRACLEIWLPIEKEIVL